VLEPLHAKLSAKIEENNLAALMRDIEMPLARVLASMEETGFLVDEEGLRAFGKDLAEQVAAEEK